MLKSGTYQVSANGALLTWRIVVSGASISGKCDGGEPLSGSVSGNTLKVRRGCPGYDPPYQDYVGKLQGGQVIGKFTGAGGVPGERYDWSMRLSR